MGGGKSQLLLGLAMTAHTKSAVFRVHSTDLEQLRDDVIGMMAPDDKWTAGSGGYGGTVKTGDGRTVQLLGCESEKDARKFMGRGRDLFCFDEIPTFNEKVFRFLQGWNRTPIVGQRCRVVCAGNPPTKAEEEWVLRYWAPWLDKQHPNPAMPGELRWFTTIDGEDREVPDGRPIQVGEYEVLPRSRTFIPAKLQDNPIYMATGYASQVNAMPEPLRSQLLFGDMNAGRKDDEWQVIPSQWVEESMRKWEVFRDEGLQRGTIQKHGDTLISTERMTVAALDPAMAGADDMCLAKRYTNWIAPLMVWPGADIHNGDDLFIRVLPYLEVLHMPILVDILASCGGTAVTVLNERLPKLDVWPINFGEGSGFRDVSGRLDMANVRAEAYWRCREALDPSMGAWLMLPRDSRLKEELCAVRWRPSGGRVQLESKSLGEDPVKKRIGRSPDRADAVVMTLLKSGSSGWIPPSQAKAQKEEPRPSVRQFTNASQKPFMGVG